MVVLLLATILGVGFVAYLARSDAEPRPDAEGPTQPSASGHAPAVASPSAASDPRAEVAAQGARVETSAGVRLVGRVVGASGLAVAGASVWVDEFALPATLVAPGGGPPKTTTGGDGRFACAAWPRPGAVLTLHVERVGYSPAATRVRTSGAGREIAVPDIVLLVGGAVTGTISGTQGRRLPDAVVELVPASKAGVDLRPPWPGNEVRTDAVGAYRFEHVPPGLYALRAAAPGHGVASSGAFAVEDESVVQQDLALPVGRSIEGLVVGRAGDAVADAEVRWRPHDGKVAFARQRSDEWGRFRLENVPPGAIDLRVSARGHLDLALEAHEADEQPLRIALEKSLAIRGVVAESTTGAPVTRSALRAVRLGDLGEHEAPGQAEAATGSMPPPEDRDGGAFAVEDLQEGLYVIDVAAAGFRRLRSDVVPLERGSPPPFLTLRLEPGWRVEGRVLGADGRPLATAVVELRRATARPAGSEAGASDAMLAWSGGDPLLRAVTDARGRFRLEDAPSGACIVRAFHEGSPGLSAVAEVSMEGDVRELELRLPSPGSIAGRVLGVAGVDLPHVQIVTLPLDGEQRSIRFARPDTAGDFVLEDLNPGGYVVRACYGAPTTVLRSAVVRQLAARQAAADVVVPAGEQVRFDIAAAAPGLGRVRGTAPRPGASTGPLRARLQLRAPLPTPHDVWVRETTLVTAVSAAGAYEFEAVPSGEYDLDLLPAQPDLEPASSPVVVGAARVTIADFVAR